MNLNELSRVVYSLYVSNGYWKEDRPEVEYLNAIQCKWDDALAARLAGRPLLQNDGQYSGVAVDLVTGCLHILAYHGKHGHKITPETIDGFFHLMGYASRDRDDDFPKLIKGLKDLTTEAGKKILRAEKGKKKMLWVFFAPLDVAFAHALMWIADRGIDPESLLIEMSKCNNKRYLS